MQHSNHFDPIWNRNVEDKIVSKSMHSHGTELGLPSPQARARPAGMGIFRQCFELRFDRIHEPHRRFVIVQCDVVRDFLNVADSERTSTDISAHHAPA